MTGRPEDPHGQTQQETLLRDAGQKTAGSPSPAADAPSSSSGSVDGGRFPPGTILASRYRVVDLLGRGGMGEVYRADDLKLGETVALKLLPERLTNDGRALARLHQEVRMARRITHHNVVRVHDVGEADGLPFIAMEYIDGEDLASLLRRIGRLPEDKALQLARQLCAGLAAAHERGLLHRDLKPANVMVDGEGHARITDFGLAGLAADLERPELAGTPLYMAPEQLARGQASFASDIYSLGLVLYEMFTGERPFRATTRAELAAEHRHGEPSGLSSAVGADRSADRHRRRSLPRARPRPATGLAAGGGGDAAGRRSAGGGAGGGRDAVAGDGGAGDRPGGAVAAAGRGAVGADHRLDAGHRLDSTTRCRWSTSTTRCRRRSWRTGPAGSSRPPAGAAATSVGAGCWTTTASVQQDRATVAGRVAQEAARRPTFLEFWHRSSPLPLAPRRRWRSRVSQDDPPPDARRHRHAQARQPGPAARAAAAAGRYRSHRRPWTRALAPTAPESPPRRDLGPAVRGRRARRRTTFGRSLRNERRRSSPNGWRPGRASTPDQASPRLLVHAATTAGDVVWWQVSERPLLDASRRRPPRGPHGAGGPGGLRPRPGGRRLAGLPSLPRRPRRSAWRLAPGDRHGGRPPSAWVADRPTTWRRRRSCR